MSPARQTIFNVSLQEVPKNLPVPPALPLVPRDDVPLPHMPEIPALPALPDSSSVAPPLQVTAPHRRRVVAPAPASGPAPGLPAAQCRVRPDGASPSSSSSSSTISAFRAMCVLMLDFVFGGFANVLHGERETQRHAGQRVIAVEHDLVFGDVGDRVDQRIDFLVAVFRRAFELPTSSGSGKRSRGSIFTSSGS